MDVRAYHSLTENLVLAGQTIGQAGFGDLPFNELGVLGGDKMMRGYYVGRYRDRTLTAAQAELRFLPLPLGFTHRIGAATWVAAGTVAPRGRPLPRRAPGHRWRRAARAHLPRVGHLQPPGLGVSEDGLGIYVYVGEAFWGPWPALRARRPPLRSGPRHRRTALPRRAPPRRVRSASPAADERPGRGRCS